VIPRCRVTVAGRLKRSFFETRAGEMYRLRTVSIGMMSRAG
jgi:hypothetical protein